MSYIVHIYDNQAECNKGSSELDNITEHNNNLTI